MDNSLKQQIENLEKKLAVKKQQVKEKMKGTVYKGFTIRECKTKTQGRDYVIWKAWKGGKNPQTGEYKQIEIYIGKNPLKAKEKIEAWFKKNPEENWLLDVERIPKYIMCREETQQEK